MKSVVSLEGIRKVYRMGEIEFEALKGVSLEINEGEMVALMGPSGSGKTTLMQIIGLLDRPSAGTYVLTGEDVTILTENERAEARNREIGFVFQAFHLLPRLSVLENVEVPLTYAGVAAPERRARALEVLEKVGLAGKEHHFPSQLSGGQKQRVAVARALTMRPAILLADEPTGNLDSKTAVDVMSLFQELNDEGTTVIIVTHEADIADYTGRIVRIRDGMLESDQPNRHRKRPVGGVA
ncbi:MAG TPA: ABC transporter ATP-binding protein [Meiothermus sp.]|nr:ABC transporter ATP-binding protein [Meiothermus sp.]